MIFLPIVARELRVAARRRATFWTRTAVALGAIATGACFYVVNLDLPSHTLSQRLFNSLMGIALVYALVSGRRFTADCLSEEKREGTLGLLFLTDLKGYDVVFGKITATSLNGFYGLLALLPVLAVPVLLGGVSNGEFWRAVLVLVVTFVYSLAIGMFVSSLSRDAHRALGANLVVLLLLSVFPPVAGVSAALSLSYNPFSSPYFHWLFYSCPIYSLFLSNGFFYAGRQEHFWASLAVIHGLTWLLLFLASRTVPHSWQDKIASPRRNRWRELWHTLSYGRAATRGLFRRKLLNVNAFYWLAARARFRPAQVWALLAFIGGYWVWTWRAYGSNWQNDSLNPTNLTAGLLFNTALKLWIAIEAGRRLAEEHKMGTFELLLSTALTERDIVHGQWLALRRQFLKPTIAVLLVECLFLLMGERALSNNYGAGLAIWVAGMIMLVADMVAVSWVAMASALIARTPNLATVSAVTRIIIAPLVIFGVVTGVFTMFAAIQGMPEPSLRFYLGWWFVLGLGADLAYGFIAWRQLHTRFRQLAAQRFTSAQPGVEQAGGGRTK